MTLSPAHISEIICTRISHDLIGNIGAVSNAVELLDEGDMDFMDDIRSILHLSSSVLSARLKFFRMAFGLNNSNLENAGTIKQTCNDYLQTIGNQSSALQLDLSLDSTVLGRMSMLTVMILADTAVKGGNLRVVASDTQISARFEAERYAAEKVKTIAALTQGILPDNLAFFAPGIYLISLASAAKMPVKVSGDDNGWNLNIG